MIDPPEEVRSEIQRIGRIRVGRYERWALELLSREVDPQKIIQKMTDKGFSAGLSEWIVYSLRETADSLRLSQEELSEVEEPPVLEVVARVLFGGVLLLLIYQVTRVADRINSLAVSIFLIPVLMLAALASMAYVGFSVADLWERWRRRSLL
jgi:hypothetical protein